MLSPNFQVATFSVEEFNLLPISITYKFKDTEKVSTKEIFKVGSSFPSTKSVTFENKVGNCQLMVHYSEGAKIDQGLPTQIAQYEISEGVKGEKTEKTSFTMRVSNNIHNVACLDEAEFIQEWTEMEKIPVKASPVTVPAKKEEEKKDDKPADAKPEAEADKKAEETKVPEPTAPAEVTVPEQLFEEKERKKKVFSSIEFTTQSFALSPVLRQTFQDLETSLFKEDLDILEQKELRNNLEAYSYEMRSNLDSYGSFEKYLDEATKTEFMPKLSKTIEWIYGEGENAPKEEYRKLLQEYKAIGEPVKKRHFYYSELDIYFAQYEQLINSIKSKLDTIIYLTELQKVTITKKIEVAQALVDGVKADRAAKKLHEDPAYNLD